MKRAIVCVLGLALGGCSTLSGQPHLAKSLGEQDAAYGYVPLDGLAVHTINGGSCPDDAQSDAWLPLQQALPDISVRFAVADLEGGGSLSYGPVAVTTQNQKYRAVVDYVNVDEVPERFFIRKFVEPADGPAAPRAVLLAYKLQAGEALAGYEVKWIRMPEIHKTPANAKGGDKQSYEDEVVQDRLAEDKAIEQLARTSDPAEARAQLGKQSWTEVTIPVYVGVGVRLSADVLALKGGVKLNSLPGIAANAEAKYLSGSLTVQTLGLNGKTIGAALPLPSKLDETTVENAILAIGAARSDFYNDTGKEDDGRATARVVGLYSPVGNDPQLINAIYSELSKERPEWPRPCKDSAWSSSQTPKGQGWATNPPPGAGNEAMTGAKTDGGAPAHKDKAKTH